MRRRVDILKEKVKSHQRRPALMAVLAQPQILPLGTIEGEEAEDGMESAGAGRRSSL